MQYLERYMLTIYLSWSILHIASGFMLQYLGYTSRTTYEIVEFIINIPYYIPLHPCFGFRNHKSRPH
eukprot:UN08004